MDLSAFGWDESFEEKFQEFKAKGLLPARVVESNRLVYKLFSSEGEIQGKLSGSFRFNCESPEEHPTVGDWVAFKPANLNKFVSIKGVVERKSSFSRKVAGKVFDEQVIAANIDKIFIVSGLDQEFNIRRLERYVLLAAESNAEFIFILNKTDLCKDVDGIIAQIENSFEGINVIALSALNNQGLEQLTSYLKPGKTIVFIGSSGVGKSTIINRLLGEERQKTGEVREQDGRGRHITSSRNIIQLPNGALVIDTPGLRELQILSSGEGLKNAFPDIEEISKSCKYRNCRHVNEAGCAVLMAVTDGTITEERLKSYHKLAREVEYNISRHDARYKNKRNKFWKMVSKKSKLMKKTRKNKKNL